MMSANTSARSRSPFTTTQWQELEHQALIFKYMVSGVPVPPDLIYSVKRSLDSSFSSRLFPHNPIGWGCFEMGFGRKVDPEPGRCRRTDGKKWRCSKEAYPDSKYCERHMHRGRNRSRKPVEVSSTTAISTTSTISSITSPPNISSMNMNRSLSTSTATISTYSSISYPLPSEPLSHLHPQHNSSLYPFLFSHSSSSRPTGYGLLPENNTTPYFSVKSESYTQPDKDYRYYNGTKESLDELAFFPESSGNARSLPETCNHPLLTSSYRGYSQPQFQSYTDNSKEPKQSDSDEQHCFVLGTDFKSPRSIKTEKEPETQKPLHHFFEEWPPKNTDSWLDLASNSRIQSP